MTLLSRFLPLMLTGVLMSACASGQPAPPATLGHPETPYPPSRPPVVGDILHLPTGIFVSEEQMLQVVADSRIAYVGETHDNPASHRLELAVLRAMHARWPGQVALGMEMFVPSQQAALNGWVTGVLTEKQFLKDSAWNRNWRLDFAYYRDLLLFARENRIPIVALNAEKSLVKAVGGSPVAELSPAEQAAIPELDLADPYQKALTASIYGGHAHGGGNMEGFLRVQTLWDETMAANIAGYLQGREQVRMVVVAGGNHVRHGFGIPRRVFRRLPISYSLVGATEIEIPADKQDRLMDVETPSFPMVPYHFLVHTRYESLEEPPVRLGVMLNENATGEVLVEGVLPDSVAAESGLLKGDRVLSVDAVPVTESLDVVYAVRQKRPGDRMILGIERNGEKMPVEASFPETTESAP
ncbi:MAG: ChaN family lipoprotein [Desulfuromonadales bacterium]